MSLILELQAILMFSFGFVEILKLKKDTIF